MVAVQHFTCARTPSERAGALQALVARIGSSLHVARDVEPIARAMPLGWPELDAVLPDGGLPRGVVEIAAPGALGGATSIALAAVRAGQARGERAWCAWLDHRGSLHAPGVAAAGVDLARMLVVRATRARAERVAVKVVASGAFEVVVVDVDAPARGELLVRRLALAAESNGATVLLLSDASKPRSAPWPTALRLEVSRPNARAMRVRVAKDKRGRVGIAKTIPFAPVVRVAVD